MEEYIYCLRNEAMPGLAKLGFSKNVCKRMKSLWTTGVPMIFDCIYAKKVKNMREAENKIFKDLSSYRFKHNREFFKIDNETIKDSFDKIEGEYIDVLTLNIEIEKKNNSTMNKKDFPEFISKKCRSSRSNYQCPRCHYETTYISSYKDHLSRKKKCNSNFLAEDPSIILEKLNNSIIQKNNYCCEYCNKSFNSPQGKYNHKQICKKNHKDDLDKIKMLEEINQLKDLINYKSININSKLKSNIIYQKNVPNYQCPRCHYETTYISSYKDHLSRKKLCIANFSIEEPSIILDKLNDSIKQKNNYCCEYCDKSFSSSQGKYNHKKICKNKNESNKLEQMQEEINQLKKLISHQL